MSTRRARIKAVAALPQRRKNADNADSKKKPDQVKELLENVIKSPVGRRGSVDKRPGSSPARTAFPSPRKSPRALRRTPDLEKVPSEWKVPTPTATPVEKRANTPLRDKTDTNKPSTWKTDVFVSPQGRASPLRKRSPIVKTPVIEVNIGVERHITPHKRLLELQEDVHKFSKVAESREAVDVEKLQSVAVPSYSNAEPKHLADGYTNPNTPETPDVMDGIVPLKPVNNAPKPIELLKSEIISENAEVLFDPIVPLPSPTKVRQKLRPVPRLGPMRRNSIPGSASESEDESRRALHGGSSTPVLSRQRHDSHTSHSTMQSLPNRDVSRVRNDSVCSTVSQMAPQTPAPLGSPLKERNVVKNRRHEVSRRMATLRRRKESVQRDKLTMFDLIFYNPMTNPIVPDQEEINAKEANKKEEERSKIESKKDEEDNEDTNDTDSSAPVPQIKLGPNGEIVLDEQSLVIKQSEQRKLSDSVVREGAWESSAARVYRRTPRTADWTDAETVRFYRALAALGTDFSLMVSLFPGRSRKDLKLKFKKEERMNLAQIDKALRSVTGWDAGRLETEFAHERKVAQEQEKKLKERLKLAKKAEKERNQTMKDLKVRQSKGSKALGMSIIPTTSAKTNHTTANDLLLQAVKAKLKRQQEFRERKEISRNGSEFAMLTPLGQSTAQLPKVGIPRLPDMATLQKSRPLTSPSIRPTPHISPSIRPAPHISPSIRPAPLISPSIRPAPHISPSVRPLPNKSPVVINALPAVPADITPGSLVVLTVDDPKAPSQKVIHTYIKQGDGSITSIILDPNVMSSLVNYVKKDTPKAGSSSSLVSPSSVSSDRTSTPPISVSPSKRKRLSSYNITNL